MLLLAGRGTRMNAEYQIGSLREREVGSPGHTLTARTPVLLRIGGRRLRARERDLVGCGHRSRLKLARWPAGTGRER